ncbi:LCP family protein [Streptomyces sp. NPDC049954]|uniref:LCP family protein n=1 Tax=Streptomyces sp. NPDC049954 TaxID=3155779 RepID=UPI00343C406C
MDAQGRGRGDDIDPADQWVLNPQTGDYELRLDTSAPQSPRVPGARRPPSARSARAPEARGRGNGPPPRPERERSAAPTVPAQGGRARARKEAAAPPGGGRAAKRRADKGGGKKKALMWTAGGLGFVLVAVAGTGFFLYRHFNGNLETIDTAGAGSREVARHDTPLNILVIGTDKRTGKGNEGYGDKNSVGHADTNILLHVSADRSNATALSIPRDLITDIPACPTKQEDGSTETVPGTQHVRFNQSLGQDGRDPGCTMRTVTELTGLKVDHFMMADFNAVKSLSTAVGGVEVCVAKPVDDPDSHLKLPAGKSVVEGEQALAFVRTRHSFGNHGDLDRIQVQQQFLGSLVRKLKSEGTLTSPSKMFKVANAATKALSVDEGIGSLSKLTKLGMELQHVDPKNITFTTLPVVDNPEEPKPVTVVVNEAKADPLLAMMKDDVSLTEVKAKESKAADAKKKSEDARLKGTRAEASEVRVEVYNGGDITGAAQAELTWLQNNQGVLKSSQRGNAPKQDTTTLSYAPDQAAQARKLADVMGLPGSALKPGKSIENDQGLPAMKLVLGRDFKGAGIALKAPAKAPAEIQRTEADKQVCAK